MKFISLILAASILALAACGKSESFVEASEPRLDPDIGKVVGAFRPPGGGTMEVRTFVANGTECVWVGRYSSSSVSCNWQQK